MIFYLVAPPPIGLNQKTSRVLLLILSDFELCNTRQNESREKLTGRTNQNDEVFRRISGQNMRAGARLENSQMRFSISRL